MVEEAKYYILDEESPDEDAYGEFFEVVSGEIGTPSFDEMCIIRANPENDGISDEDLAKARRVVLALNCHAELLAALKGLAGLNRTPDAHASPEILAARAIIAKVEQSK